MIPSFDIVPADTRHIAGIYEIESLCFSHPWSAAQFADELNYDYARLLAAVEEGSVIGFISFHIVCGCAHINNLAVLPMYRKMGVGARLVDAALAEARAADCECFTLEVRQSNTAAKSLYSQKGFNTAGIRRGFYRDPPEDGETMLLNLR